MATHNSPALVFDCFGVLHHDAFKEFVVSYAGSGQASATALYHYADHWDRGKHTSDEAYAHFSAISGVPAAELQRRFRDTSGVNVAAADLVRELAPHYRLGVLSNAERHFLDQFLTTAGLAEVLEVVVASSETPYDKPDRGIFELTAERFSLPLSQLVFIDDSAGHVQAAAGYGLQAYQYQSAPELRAWLHEQKLLA